MKENANKKIYRCRKCNEPILLPSENKFFPFCSERCKMIDLGRWLEEGYVIDKPQKEVDLEF